MPEGVITAIVGFLGAVLGALAGGWVSLIIQERKLKHDFELDREKVRTEFIAEQAAKQLLESEKWQKRSFEEIQKRLGGFEENELRRILVRAGAVRFMGNEDKELWGLLTRNKDTL
jgi:hypothetical protein